MQNLIHFLTETAGDGTVVEETNKFVEWCTDNAPVITVVLGGALLAVILFKIIKKVIKSLK